ncbi:long-chain-fatty-acid--AMP ligase FadD32 domain protein [Mycobacterium xenopi 4042]|uniref:Long-chain-fatty-acid--AMP ligase FadD32 domain protein n=1 Tax=Mycobacterium xenopi 4042 TaxID=1299334 RepID=X8DLM8_MYCXE|nr:long-chain-fatty-acid--AMP ligase FadD32 domain protein [Mycobacterium xenopi 4042]
MAYHNPYIVDGHIRFPDNTNLVMHVERWAKVRGQRVAYRFWDYSTERDGVAREMSWVDFAARNRAVGARLQQVTKPGTASRSCVRRIWTTSSRFSASCMRAHRGAAVRPG